MNCRFCGTKLDHVFVDLGTSPLANSFLSPSDLKLKETFYPLCTFVCEECYLVQLDQVESPKNIFSNYAYFSSYSETWLKHVQSFVTKMIGRFRLDKSNQIIEIASNDGYLLQHFKKKNISVLGIEPASNIAKVAEEKGIPTLVKFFDSQTAEELVTSGKKTDLLIAFNVLPHVPDLNDFLKGMKILLKPNGIIVIQFSAHILQLIKQNEFDMIYHEHFSYFSLLSVQRILAFSGLTIFDVEELPIHGGSLRLYVRHTENTTLPVQPSLNHLLQKEQQFGLTDLSTYGNFQRMVNETKNKIHDFFINAKSEGKKIVCYGAPAKGNTLLNYCGIGTDFIDYTVDRNPHKQGLFLPGTHIPVYPPEKIAETKPDYLVILSWNLKDEIMEQMSHIFEWGGKFIVLIPEVKIYP